MSSILAIDPEILLIGLAMPLGVALIVGMAALLWRKRNGNGQRHVEEVAILAQRPAGHGEEAVTDQERIARLERMVFLMLSIMNGTIFASQVVAHQGSSNLDAFGAQLEELWHLQREMDPQPMAETR